MCGWLTKLPSYHLHWTTLEQTVNFSALLSVILLCWLVLGRNNSTRNNRQITQLYLKGVNTEVREMFLLQNWTGLHLLGTCRPKRTTNCQTAMVRVMRMRKARTRSNAIRVVSLANLWVRDASTALSPVIVFSPHMQLVHSYLFCGLCWTLIRTVTSRRRCCLHIKVVTRASTKNCFPIFQRLDFRQHLCHSITTTQTSPPLPFTFMFSLWSPKNRTQIKKRWTKYLYNRILVVYRTFLMFFFEGQFWNENSEPNSSLKNKIK